MAFVPYVPPDAIPPEHRVPDDDHILRVHGVHSAVMRKHYDLFLEVMRTPGPVSRVQREMIAVVVSATNGCHY
jgi:alkylhydroperoxidase family enzyme